MTQHNIIGSEAFSDKAHVVVRQFARPRPSSLRMAVIAVQFVACALFLGMVWSVLG